MKHPYDSLYLQEIAETQGALFERLQDVEPTADGVDFVRSYMKSDTRALIDKGDVYLATIGSKGLMDYYRKEDRPGLKSGESLRGFVPNWMGQFYAHYQWRTGGMSSEIVDAIPPEWLCAAYPGLHDLSLELAVEKVSNEMRRCEGLKSEGKSSFGMGSFGTGCRTLGASLERWNGGKGERWNG